MSVRTSGLLALLAISCALSCAAADSEVYSYSWNHPRLVEVQLMDDTDRHDELYFEKEYLLSRCEKPFDVSAPALFIEDSLTGEGIAFFRKAPLPHARTSNSPDWHVDPLGRKVTVLSNDYQGVSIRYRGGKAGRIRAATDFQRRFRPYVAGRDGLFLSNTWGDGNRDACINERFLLAEVASGAELGVDVIQIDDGWQKGRSANSASLAAGEKGRWGSWWEVEGFWDVDPVRFPNGLGKVIGEARSKGMKFGLWFGPDSSNDAANWNKDADFLLSLHRDLGVDYFKFDSMHTPTPLALSRQAMLMDRLMDESDGRITIDLDVTAGRRPGYFAFPRIGPVFVENRYIRENDVRLWWPHRTLRNLWGLAHVVDPVRLRMEVLNPERKSGLYPNGDPLTPICWPRDAIFAISMYSSPLGWFEIQNLSQETVAAWKPLIAQWKRERDAIHDGYIYPVGSAPDGLAWTGFVSAAKDGSAGTALLFRELDASEEFSLPLPDYLNVEGLEPIVIGGRGEVKLHDVGVRTLHLEQMLGLTCFEEGVEHQIVGIIMDVGDCHDGVETYRVAPHRVHAQVPLAGSSEGILHEGYALALLGEEEISVLIFESESTVGSRLDAFDAETSGPIRAGDTAEGLVAEEGVVKKGVKWIESDQHPFYRFKVISAEHQTRYLHRVD